MFNSRRSTEDLSAKELLGVNQQFYESLWADAKLIAPHRFNTWPLFSELARSASRRLEVAPGLRPRLPLKSTCFIDLSPAALRRLREYGGDAVHGIINALPYANTHFDLICALDILEHVVDDDEALRELARVAAPNSTLLLSVPLHPAAWTPFDDFVGHYRRYEPSQILEKLARHGFALEQSAIYGMQPKSSHLLKAGQWYLTHQRERAMWWYNRVFMPLGLRFQKPLRWRNGFCNTTNVDELLLRCRYRC